MTSVCKGALGGPGTWAPWSHAHAAQPRPVGGGPWINDGLQGYVVDVNAARVERHAPIIGLTREKGGAAGHGQAKELRGSVYSWAMRLWPGRVAAGSAAGEWRGLAGWRVAGCRVYTLARGLRPLFFIATAVPGRAVSPPTFTSKRLRLPGLSLCELALEGFMGLGSACGAALLSFSSRCFCRLVCGRLVIT